MVDLVQAPGAVTQHVEVVAVIVRGGATYRRPGDVFAWTCYIVRDGVDSGYVLALLGAPTLSDLRRARDELRALGFRRVTWDRTDGSRHTMRLA
jgi:hypothetical protein